MSSTGKKYVVDVTQLRDVNTMKGLFNMFIKKKKNARFGRYPSCDMANNALRFLLQNKPEIAFEEIAHAIVKAGGYFHEDIADAVKKRMDWID